MKRGRDPGGIEQTRQIEKKIEGITVERHHVSRRQIAKVATTGKLQIGSGWVCLVARGNTEYLSPLNMLTLAKLR
jgi:hypothetical protein